MNKYNLNLKTCLLRKLLFFFGCLIFILPKNLFAKNIINIEAKGPKIAFEKARQKCGGYPPIFIEKKSNLFSFQCSEVPDNLKSQAEKRLETSHCSELYGCQTEDPQEKIVNNNLESQKKEAFDSKIEKCITWYKNDMLYMLPNSGIWVKRYKKLQEGKKVESSTGGGGVDWESVDLEFSKEKKDKIKSGWTGLYWVCPIEFSNFMQSGEYPVYKKDNENNDFFRTVTPTLAKSNNWYYELKTDDFDDTKISEAYAVDDYYSSYKKYITLIFKCDLQTKKITLSVDLEDAITRYNYPFVLKYRIKPNKPLEVLMQTWSNAYSGGYSENEKEIKLLAKSILDAEEDKKLFIRIRNNKAEEFDAKIDLSGANDKIQKVYADCNKKFLVTPNKKLETKKIKTVAAEKNSNAKKSINFDSVTGNVLIKSFPKAQVGKCSDSFAGGKRGYYSFEPDTLVIRDKLNQICEINFNSSLENYFIKAKNRTKYCENSFENFPNNNESKHLSSRKKVTNNSDILEKNILFNFTCKNVDENTIRQVKSDDNTDIDHKVKKTKGTQTVKDNRQIALDKVKEYKNNKNTVNNAYTQNFSGSKQQLIDRFTDPGYVDSSFPQNESFWVAIKSPPPNSDIYAKMVCKIAKTEYGLKGFVVTIWGFDRKKYGKYGCY